MAEYGEIYYRTLENINQKYLPLHNLNQLSNYQKKLQCYSQHQAEPHQYYECFSRIEGERDGDARKITASYQMIEEDYKLCEEGCRNQGSPEGCSKACASSYGSAIKLLYDNFYREKVGTRKEYKSAVPK